VRAANATRANPVVGGYPSPVLRRAAVLAAALLLAVGGVARADDGLTGRVASVFLLRNVDAPLHQIAHERVAELAACQCLEHDGMRDGTAEVLALNSGMADPVGMAVQQWIDSPPHHAILSNAGYGRIGCAETVTGGTHWFVCVLAPGPLPPQPAPIVAAPAPPAPPPPPASTAPPPAAPSVAPMPATPAPAFLDACRSRFEVV
jgi:hypothetical protein